MKTKKEHIPAPGKANGLSGTSLCGKWSEYLTGDHEMIREQARRAIADDDISHYCAVCIRKIMKQRN